MNRLLFLFLIIGLSSNASFVAAQRNQELLFGKVRSIVTSSYAAEEKFGEISGKHLDHKSITKYEKNGQIDQRNSYFANGDLDCRTETDYDSNGAKVEERLYNRTGKLYLKWLYKYDVSGKVGEVEAIDEYGKVFSLDKYKYNSNGMVIEISDQDLYFNHTTTCLLTYNTRGFITEIRDYANGRLTSTNRYEYDEYDGFGNWIIRRHYSGTELIVVEEREILYYY